MLLLAGCIPTPGFDLPSATTDDPFETDGAYDPGEGPEDDDAKGEADGSDSGTGGDDSTGGVDPSGPWDPSDDGTGTGGVESTAGGSEGTDTDAPGGESSGESGDEPLPAFPAPPPFGDDAGETGLVGTWTVAWNPDGTPHWTLDIDDDGTFAWTEAAAACTETAAASGQLWVEGGQIVMHIETWDKRDPWPVESVVGQPLALPFRLHLDYALALGQLSVSGPWELTAMLGWQGRVYARTSGAGPAGMWTTSASLEAILPGEDTPKIIATDTYQMETAGGAQAHETMQRTWTHGDAPLEQPPSTETSPWFNLTPGQAQGMISIGGITHLYDAERLVGYDETRVFSEEAPQGCG
ncbi:MAG: hypothetical protein ACE37F_28450 [Nannocystaceae bacterium]|nr:hypothetical protein [bacterium]